MVLEKDVGRGTRNAVAALCITCIEKKTEQNEVLSVMLIRKGF